jgi:hypothetical protein
MAAGLQQLPAPLAATLDALAPALSALRHDWWLIGSAAMTLLGVEGLEVGDVDLLAHPDDARTLLSRFGAGCAVGEVSDRFRSQVFGRWRGGPLPVEVLGGLHVRVGTAWVRLQPSSRQALDCRGVRLYAPSVAEMIEICAMFGRDKDRERAARLYRLVGVEA